MSFIDNLRKKPEAERIKILWITLAVSLVILIAIWGIVGTYKPGGSSGNPLLQSFQQAADSSKNINLHNTK